jgi:hypothetical protein
MNKELRSERLKTVVGITTHRNPVTQELYQSVRVGEDIVKRIKTSRQKGYILRKGESVEEVSSIWQNLPQPMKKIDAFKFASRDPRSDFITNAYYVAAFEEKISHIEGRLIREANRVSRPKVNSAEELLKLIKSTPENTVEESTHVNMGQ